MKKFFQKSAFTFVELIVTLTISMIIMTAVMIFVENGFSTIYNVKKVSSANSKLDKLTISLMEILDSKDKNSALQPKEIGNGVLFKTKGGFGYIGLVSGRTEYCSDSKTNPNGKTNHIYIKKFTPLIKNSVAYSGETLTGGYSSDSVNHVVRKGNSIIIGKKGLPGNRIPNSKSGALTYLNSPTGLALNGNKLYISDTGNNRILVYDTFSKEVEVLLSEENGISESTGLRYESNKLLIANVGKGEILALKAPGSGPTNSISMNFNDAPTNMEYNKVVFTFSGESHDYLATSNNPTINLVNDYYLEKDEKKLTYSILKCDYSLKMAGMSCLPGEDDKIIKRSTNFYKCKYYSVIGDPNTNTGVFKCDNSGITLKNSTISISNLTFKNDLDIGSYYVNAEFYSGATLVYKDYFPFFYKSDSDLTTIEDNILEIESTGLDYPIVHSAGTGNLTNLTSITNLDLNYSPNTDILLDFPINSANFSVDDNMVKVIFDYERDFSCDVGYTSNTSKFILKK